jgi:hypothetical protein
MTFIFMATISDKLHQLEFNRKAILTRAKFRSCDFDRTYAEMLSTLGLSSVNFNPLIIPEIRVQLLIVLQLLADLFGQPWLVNPIKHEKIFKK